MAERKMEITTVPAQKISALVGDGSFSSEHGVSDEGLALVVAEQAHNGAKMKALLDAAQVGIDDIEAGRFETFHSPEELEARILEIWDEALRDAKAA